MAVGAPNIDTNHITGSGGGGTYTDEQAQDAVGSILTDSASIDFTYDDATPSITATAIAGTSAGTVAAGDDSRITGAVQKSTYDANTVLAATLDNTPTALTIAEQTLLGRITAGAIAALTPAQVRTLLALVIGTNVQAWDADLDSIAGIAPSNDDVIQRKAGAWTNRSMAQLATDVSAAGIVATDVIWDAAGDTLTGTGSNTGARLAVGTTPGTAYMADPAATNKISWGFPQGVAEAKSGAASTSLASTLDRAVIAETNTALLSTARLSLVRIMLPKGMTVNNIIFYSATTALNTGVNQWFALFDLNKGKLAVTGDDTSTAWAANASKSLAISGGFVTTYSGLYYLGIMVKATTVPTIACSAALGAGIFRTGAGGNFVSATADTGLTNPASCPSTAGSLSSVSNIPYAEVS